MGWIIEYNAEGCALYMYVGPGWHAFGYTRDSVLKNTGVFKYSNPKLAKEKAGQIQRAWPGMKTRIREE